MSAPKSVMFPKTCVVEFRHRATAWVLLDQLLVSRRYFVAGILPDGPLADGLSLQELQQLREQIQGSIDRTHGDLDRIEALILAATLRDQRRGDTSRVVRESVHRESARPPTDHV